VILTDEDLHAVIDACVLANARVTEVLLSLVKYEEAFEPKWTVKILDEMQRAQVGFGWVAEHAESYRGAMSARFRRAEVRGYERWISHCTNHEGDRHVLAAAIEAKVPAIVTFNTIHFKPPDLVPWRVRALLPDDYLLGLYERKPEAVWRQIKRIAEKRGRTVNGQLTMLHEYCPKFADRLLTES